MALNMFIFFKYQLPFGKKVTSLRHGFIFIGLGLHTKHFVDSYTNRNTLVDRLPRPQLCFSNNGFMSQKHLTEPANSLF